MKTFLLLDNLLHLLDPRWPDDEIGQGNDDNQQLDDGLGTKLHEYLLLLPAWPLQEIGPPIDDVDQTNDDDDKEVSIETLGFLLLLLNLS